MRFRPSPLLLGIALASPLAAACQPPAPPPPEEKWAVVTSEVAPLLGELEDDDDAQEVLRKGEFVKVVHEIRDFHWDARMEGVEGHRKGMAVEIRTADEGGASYAFLPDFAAEVSIPVTSWLCGAIAAQVTFDVSRCAASLRRARTPDGALVVYMACTSGPCPVGLLRNGKLALVAVENMASARFLSGSKHSLLVAQTRWSKADGRQSGGALVPIVLDGPAPIRMAPIPTDEVDARDPAKLLSRTAHATVTTARIELQGEEVVKSADGTVLSQKPVTEAHPLPALD